MRRAWLNMPYNVVTIVSRWLSVKSGVRANIAATAWLANEFPRVAPRQRSKIIPSI